MPRFYFHLHNDIDVRDDEGVELADVLAARAYAKTNARQLMGEMLKEEGRISLHHRIDIEDATGLVLDTVFFGHAVEIEG